jgi:hypothetical protein
VAKEIDKNGRRAGRRPIAVLAAMLLIAAGGAIFYFLPEAKAFAVSLPRTIPAMGGAWWMLPAGLVALMVFVAIFRAVGYRHLSLLQKSLAASILIHILLMVVLGAVPVSRAVMEYVARQTRPEQTVDLNVGREAELSLEIRAKASEVPVARPSVLDIPLIAQDSTPPSAPSRIPEPEVQKFQPRASELAMDAFVPRPAVQDPIERVSVTPPPAMTAMPDISVRPVVPVRQDEPQPVTPSIPRALTDRSIQPAVEEPGPLSPAFKVEGPGILSQPRPIIEGAVGRLLAPDPALSEKVNPMVTANSPAVDVQSPAVQAKRISSPEDLGPPIPEAATGSHRLASGLASVSPAQMPSTMPAVPVAGAGRASTLGELSLDPARRLPTALPAEPAGVLVGLSPLPSVRGPEVRPPVVGRPAKSQEPVVLPGLLEQVGALQHPLASSGVPSALLKPPPNLPTTGPAVGSLAVAQISVRRPGIADVVVLPATQPAVAVLMPGRLAGPESLFHRSDQARQKLIADLGGTKESEAAVSRALAFMARLQEEDGRWGQGDAKGSTRGRHDVAITGLAALCFLACDHTPTREGPYQKEMKKAIDFLLAQQKEDGDLRGGGDMYDQAIATLAVSEAAIMTQQDKYAQAAKKAAEFITKAQNRQTGSWRYAPQESGDTSVLGWQVMALHSAEQLGFAAPKETKEGALRWLNSVSATGSLKAGYQGALPTPTMTAEAVFSRILLGQQLTQVQLAEASAYLMANPPDDQSPPKGDVGKNEYYWYYATLALMHMRCDSWAKWNEKMRDLLVARQQREGKLEGSWNPDSKYGARGGRIYTTSMAALTLEVYYRYLPMYKRVANSGEPSKPSPASQPSPGR